MGKEEKVIRTNNLIQVFDKKSYLNSFKFEQVLSFIFLLAFVIVILDPIKYIFNKIVLNYFISKIDKSIFVEISLIILLLFSIIKILKRDKYSFPSINTFIKVILLLIFYFLFIREDKSYFLIKMDICFIHAAYLDIAVLSAIFLFIPIKTYYLFNKNSNDLSFIEDQEYDLKIDELGRKHYASKLVEHINHTSTDSSFAIAINGEWGSGKTDFLKRIKSELNLDEYIIIEFNPWTVNGSENIGTEYFNLFSERIYKFNRVIADKIRDYSKRVFQTGREVHFRFFDLIIQEIFKENSIKDKFELINSTIKLSGKKIVVFIDDIDRLSGNEIFEVLKLIRNSGNFANTFYLVAFDEKYVKKALSNLKMVSNEDQYLMKIFQLNVQLPGIHQKDILTKIRKLMFGERLTEQERKLDLVFSRLSINQNVYIKEYKLWSINEDNYLEKILSNYRDVKRFCNSLKFTLGVVGDEIELIDLVILELLKVKYFFVYRDLMNLEYVDTNYFDKNRRALEHSVFVLNNSKLTARFNHDSKVSENERDMIGKLLEYLFSENEKGPRRFARPSNYYLYFSYQIFDKISIKEFYKVLESPKEEMFDFFKKWNDKNYFELNELIESRNYDNYLDIYKAIWVYLCLSNSSNNYLPKAADLFIRTVGIYNSFYSSENNEFRYFKFINDESIARLVRCRFISAIISRGRNVLEDVESSLDNGLKFMANLLSQEINDPSSNVKNIYDMYFHTNIEDYRDGNIFRNEYSTKIYKEYILSNETVFIEFTKLLIYPISIDVSGGVFIDPIIKYIFIEETEFINKLNEIKTADTVFNIYRKILSEKLTSMPKNYNEKNVFDVGENEKKIINNHLRDLGRIMKLDENENL